MGPLTQTGSNPIILTPTFETAGPVFSVGWQTVSFTFTATNNATNLTIGNFRDDANTTVQQFATPNGVFGYAYYYFDEISLIEQSPLPVEWLSLAATASPNEALLEWSVAPLTEDARFVIERSEDGVEFYAFGERLASPGETIFAFRDAAIQNEQYYYRLVYYGADGQRTMSRVMRLQWDGREDFSCFYDASKRSLVLERSPKANQNTKLTLYDLNGRVRFKTQMKVGSFRLPNDLQSGLYLLELAQEGRQRREKLWIR
ncbi:MAG: T9SS type A sorting domain-containing protein [Bacteroidota bacterium]